MQFSSVFFKHMSDTDIVVGIDLGTTYSEIYTYKNNQLEVIAGPNQIVTTPSRVIVSESSTQDNITFLQGMRGRMQNNRLPGNEIYEPKRIIGRKMSDQYIIQDLYYYPFKIIEGPNETPLYEVKGKGEDVTLDAIQVDAQILRTLAGYRPNIKRAVITVPAYFREEQINATKEAGKLAGLDVLACIPEPIAAAIAYDHAHQAKNQTIMVYDLGGGTFDCCVVRIANGKFKVLTSEGHSHLGGADFDNAIVQYVRDKIKAANPAHDVFSRKKDLRRLKDLAEKAKIALSSAETYQIQFSTTDPLTHETFDFSTLLTRAEFNTLIENDVGRTFEYIDRSLEQLGLQTQNIDQVVVVGGSTQIPVIQEKLSAYFKRPIDTTLVNLAEAVAQGAAIYATAFVNGNNLIDMEESMSIRPKSDTSFGTNMDPIYSVPYDIVMYDDFQQLLALQKGHKIKNFKRVNRDYSLPYDNMAKVRLNIFKVDKEKECIGILELPLLEPIKKGVKMFSLRLEIDQYGQLTVSLQNSRDGYKEQLNLTCRGDRLDNQIERTMFKKQYEAEQIWKKAMDKLCTMDNTEEVVQKRKALFEYSERFNTLQYEDVDSVDLLIQELKNIEG